MTSKKNKATSKYLINKPIFEQLLIPIFDRDIKFRPKLLIQIQVKLPYYLPFPDEQPILLKTNLTTAILIQYTHKIKPCPPIIEGLVSKSLINGEKYSIVEFNFFSSENSFMNDSDEAIPNYGDWILRDCITILNDFALTFSLKYNDFGVYRINPLMLRKFHNAQIVNLENWETEMVAIITPDILHRKREEISRSEASNFPVAVKAYKANNPLFLFYQELSLRSIRNLNEGNLREALVNRQTSIEVFFSNILKFKYGYDGGDSNMVNELIKSKGIAHAISSNMPEFLGGAGFNNTDGTPFRNWKIHCYELRNKVIHNGHNPSFIETNSAFESCNVFIHYTLFRIKMKKKKYPGMHHIVPLNNATFKVPEQMKKFFK